MLSTTILALLVVMLLALIRAFLGPTVYDRALAVNVFGTKTVLLIAMMHQLFGHSGLLDIALVYALINFISVIGVLKYFEATTARQENTCDYEHIEYDRHHD